MEIEQQLPKEKWKLNNKIKKDIYKQKPAASELQVHEKWWKTNI